METRNGNWKEGTCRPPYVRNVVERQLLGEHAVFGRAATKQREMAVTCHGGFRFNPVLVANCKELTRDVMKGPVVGSSTQHHHDDSTTHAHL